MSRTKFLFAMGMLSFACGGTSSTSSQEATPRRASQADDCGTSREQIIELVTRSQDRPCESSDECVSVLGSRGREQDFNIVVHRLDATEAQNASSHILKRCKPSAFTDPELGNDVVSGRCTESGCVADVTSTKEYDF